MGNGIDSPIEATVAGVQPTPSATPQVNAPVPEQPIAASVGSAEASPSAPGGSGVGQGIPAGAVGAGPAPAYPYGTVETARTELPKGARLLEAGQKGLYGGAADVFDTMDGAADIISNITGLDKGGVFGNISTWMRAVSDDTISTPEGFSERLVQGLGSLGPQLTAMQATGMVPWFTLKGMVEGWRSDPAELEKKYEALELIGAEDMGAERYLEALTGAGIGALEGALIHLLFGVGKAVGQTVPMAGVAIPAVAMGALTLPDKAPEDYTEEEVDTFWTELSIGGMLASLGYRGKANIGEIRDAIRNVDRFVDKASSLEAGFLNRDPLRGEIGAFGPGVKDIMQVGNFRLEPHEPYRDKLPEGQTDLFNPYLGINYTGPVNAVQYGYGANARVKATPELNMITGDFTDKATWRNLYQPSNHIDWINSRNIKKGSAEEWLNQWAKSVDQRKISTQGFEAVGTG